MPQDSESDLVSRTVRSNTVVDEFVFKGTHSRIMHFFLPVSHLRESASRWPHVAVIQFRDGLIESEHATRHVAGSGVAARDRRP